MEILIITIVYIAIAAFFLDLNHKLSSERKLEEEIQDKLEEDEDGQEGDTERDR